MGCLQQLGKCRAQRKVMLDGYLRGCAFFA